MAGSIEKQGGEVNHGGKSGIAQEEGRVAGRTRPLGVEKDGSACLPPSPARKHQAGRCRHGDQQEGQEADEPSLSFAGRGMSRGGRGSRASASPALRIRSVDCAIAVVVLAVGTDLRGSLWYGSYTVAIVVRIRRVDVRVRVVAVIPAEKGPDPWRTKLPPAKAGVHVTMRRTPYAAVTEPAPPKAGGMSATPQVGLSQRPASNP